MPKFKEFPLSDLVDPVPGEPLRYYVQSRSRRNIKHLVDLAECGYNSACSCEAFQMRLLPQMRKDRAEGYQIKRRCVHIKKAMEFHAELSARIVVRDLEKKANSNEPY